MKSPAYDSQPALATDPASMVERLHSVIKLAQDAGYRIDFSMDTYEKSYKEEQFQRISLVMRLPVIAKETV